MKNITFLRTVALISYGKLSHLTYRWKGGTSFTLEQIASILYKIERKRAKGIAKILGTLIGLLCGAICLYGAYMMHPYAHVLAFISEGQPAVGWAQALSKIMSSFLTLVFIVGFPGAVAISMMRYIKRIVRLRLMSATVPTDYARELNKFSDALQEAMKYLGYNLRTVISLHRDDIAAQAAALLDSKAMEVVQLERALDDNVINDDIYDRIEAEVSQRREEFKLAYAALAALNLVSGGYTNFFRRAMNASKEVVAA